MEVSLDFSLICFYRKLNADRERHAQVQTGACAVANVINPKPEDSVAVFGLGGVGMSAIMVIQPHGHPQSI